MRLWLKVRSVLRNLLAKKKLDDQLEQELQAYVDQVTDERIASGMEPSEARRSALAEFGGIEPVKQNVRDRRSGMWIETLWRDIHYGIRQLLRNPGFTLTVVLTLALSIGANTAVFSLVNALMLKDVPYPDPQRVGMVFRLVQGDDPFDGNHWIDGERWELLRDRVPSVLGAVSSGHAEGVNFEAGEHVGYVHAGRVSSQYFAVLGVPLALGRGFSEAEDRPHGPKSVILSFALWQDQFHQDPHLIGQSIHLKGESYTVVGVLPRGATTPLNADLYTDLQASREGEGSGSNFEVIVRLRDHATWQQADAEINRAWSDWASLLAKQMKAARISFYSVPLKRGQAAAVRPQVEVLMFASGLILLIACANLAGLMLVRISRRTPELATRLALGSSRWHIQRQLWIESLLLACFGGLSGIGTGFLALRGLLGLLPVDYLPVAGVSLDGTVLAFTTAVSVLTSILFGILPALAVRKMDLRSSMLSRSVAGAGGNRVRQVLIATEVALTVVLLAASGLLIRTLIHLETMPAGFNPHGVMAAKASLDDARYHDPIAFRKLLDESVAAMERIPGVTQSAVGLSLPYEQTLNDSITLSDGKESGREVQADFLYVTPGYFSTLQIPVLGGRAFTPADGPNSQKVAIVNQTFARRFFHGENPIGRSFHSGPATAVIVGVVADVQLSSGLNRIAPLQTEETVYIPASQLTSPNDLALLHTWYQPGWIVRTAGPVEGLTGQMQRALGSVAPGLPFSGFYSMSDLQARTLATQRVQVALLGTMAGLALLLSAVGIFALVASSIAQRTREIGIRLALGSTIVQAISHVATVGMLPVGAGLGIGLLGCIGALRVMRSALYGIAVYDGPSIVTVISILAGIALLAAVLPALRVTGIDPATTLRES